jgi:hypothetical protein
MAMIDVQGIDLSDNDNPLPDTFAFQHLPRVGDIVSVRGHGTFKVEVVVIRDETATGADPESAAVPEVWGRRCDIPQLWAELSGQ